MTAAQRWWCVLIGTLVLAVTPALVRARPAPETDFSAVTLVERVTEAGSVPYSGLVHTSGTVALPDADQLSGLAKLFGTSSRVRVWWQDPQVWRVATLRPTGETDLIHAGNRMIRWVYESKNATLIPDSPIRLPDIRDMLPPELGRWALGQARPSEVSKLPPRRVAGHDAVGVRLNPATPGGSISRVEVYVDAESALPVSVEIFARGATEPALSSTFEDLTIQAPAAQDLAFAPPPDANLRFDRYVDLAAAVDRFSEAAPPSRLAGLPSRLPTTSAGSNFSPVGVFGRGPTVLLAVPLDRRTAEDLCGELEGQPGAVELAEGILVASAPLGLLLTRGDSSGTSWLLAGTVTRSGLRSAATQLIREADGRRARLGPETS
ncbi:hypothetical protein BH18ACT9_BH18ACT9_04600 [soil metagenome]